MPAGTALATEAVGATATVQQTSAAARTPIDVCPFLMNVPFNIRYLGSPYNRTSQCSMHGVQGCADRSPVQALVDRYRTFASWSERSLDDIDATGHKIC